MALLELRGVSRRFGGVRAVDAVDIEVHPGDVLGVIGPNGAGKTTLFSMVAGTIRPTAGTIRFDGTDVTGWSPEQAARAGVVRTDQNTRPFDSMSALDNVVVGALLHDGPAGARRAARGLLDAVGLGHREHVLAGALSTGQRKRLEVARAMATKPRLLLLDEMTGGVDQRTIPELLDLIAWLASTGVTLMVIEHNQQAMMRLATRIVALHLGRVLATGAPDEVTRDPAVVEAYLGPSFVEPVAGPGDAR